MITTKQARGTIGILLCVLAAGCAIEIMDEPPAEPQVVTVPGLSKLGR